MENIILDYHEVSCNFLERTPDAGIMVNFLERTPDAGIISPKIKVYKNKNYLWYAGAKINFRRNFITKLPRSMGIRPTESKI